MNLYSRIEAALNKIGHGWTSLKKAETMAAAIVALRPSVSVEIGVYAGKGLITLGLAHKEIGSGMAYGYDPYSQTASLEGQTNPGDIKFWSELDHESIYQICNQNIGEFAVGKFVTLVRKSSMEASPPDNIGFLRIDGNHGNMVERDVMRFTPKCKQGAILFLDDLGWTGGAVSRAAIELKNIGWREMYSIDDGSVFMKL